MALIWPVTGDKEDWKLRSDVLFHFYAYQHFSHMFSKQAGIDLVNLTDGDVQFYNRTYDNIKGTREFGKLAMYLHDFSITHPSICGLSHRRRLICHVREYNRTVDPRRRFYMLNLSGPELTALRSNPRLPNGRLIRPRYDEKVRIATDGLMDAIWDGEAYRDESFVDEKVMDCLASFEGSFKDDQYVGRVEEDEGQAGSGASGEEGEGGREQGVQDYFMARHGEYVLAGEFARLRLEDEATAASIVLPPNYRGHNRDPDSF